MSYADPSLQLQKAMVAWLKADAGVTAVINGRIYDTVPPQPTFPYVSFGPFQMLPEHGSCLDGGEAFIQLDGWSRENGTVQVKQLGTAVAKALDLAEIMLEAPQRLVEMTIEQTQYLRDPDGITAHAVITVHAFTEPAALVPKGIAAAAGSATAISTIKIAAVGNAAGAGAATAVNAAIVSSATASAIGTGAASAFYPYFNFSAAQFAILSDAFIRVSSGSGRALGVNVGDSTTMGFDGGDGNTAMVNAKANSWPSIMANRLTTLGVQSNWENIAATQGNVNATPDSSFQTGGYKIGMNMGGGWTAQGVSSTLGGMLFTSTAAGTFSYTPEIAVDNFELWDIVNVGLGTISYNVDGGTDTNLVQAAGAAASRRTVIPAGSSGTHTLNLKLVASQGYIGGFRAWNSAVKAMDWINCGRGSSTTADWIVSALAYSSLPVLANLTAAADFVTIMLGENDELQSFSQTTFKTNYQSIINTVVAGGANVLMITPIPLSIGTLDDTTQQAMRQWCRDLAITNNLPLLDLFSNYGDWNAMNNAGLMFSGGHPNKAGYASIGTLVGNTLNTWATAAAAVPPVLSSASVTAYTATTADLSVVTSKGNGVLYWVISTIATPPTAAQVKLGQSSSGSAATSSGNQTVTVRGTQTKTGASGLTSGTTYYAYFMHEDVGAHQSNVAATTSFVPATQVTAAYTDFAIDNTAQTTYTWSSKAFAIGAANATRLVVVDVNWRAGGTTITANSCTIGGIAATKVDEARSTNGGALTCTTRWQAAVPSGTTATVSAVYSGAVSRAGAIVYTILNSNGSAPTGANTANATAAAGSVSASITVPTNGKALISGIINQGGSTPSVTPTNFVVDLASTLIGSTNWMTGGHDTNTGARSYTIAWSVASGPTTAIIASGWSP